MSWRKSPAAGRREIFRQIEARKRRNNRFIASARNDEPAEKPGGRTPTDFSSDRGAEAQE